MQLCFLQKHVCPARKLHYILILVDGDGHLLRRSECPGFASLGPLGCRCWWSHGREVLRKVNTMLDGIHGKYHIYRCFSQAKLHVCRTCLPAMGKKQRGYIEYILSLMIFPAINVHLYGIFTCHVWLPKGNAIDPKTYGITWLDGLEMLTRRISSCGVTKRKGLRWLTVILSLIFTCSWSYAGTLFLDWFLLTDEVSTALQIKNWMPK